MEIQDKVNGSFLAAKDTEYIARLEEMLLVTNKVITELIAAQGGEVNLTAALEGFAKLDGLVGNLEGNGKRIKDIAAAVNHGDVPNLGQISSMISLGAANYGDIPITGFNVGALGEGDLPIVYQGGLAPLNVNRLIRSDINSPNVLKVGDGALIGSPSALNTQCAFEVRQDHAAGDAMVLFIVKDVFASYFGLRRDGKWAVGGSSMGENSYALFHAGNKPGISDVTGLQADLNSKANDPTSARYEMLIKGESGDFEKLAGIAGDGQFAITIKNGKPTLEPIVTSLKNQLHPKPINIEEYASYAIPVASAAFLPGLNGQHVSLSQSSFTVKSLGLQTLYSFSASTVIGGVGSKWLDVIPSQVDNVYYLLGRSNDNYCLVWVNPFDGTHGFKFNAAQSGLGYPQILDSYVMRFTFLRQDIDGNLFIETGHTNCIRFEINKDTGVFIQADPNYFNPASGTPMTPNDVYPLHCRPTLDGNLVAAWGNTNTAATEDNSYVHVATRHGEPADQAARSILKGDTTANVGGYVSGVNGWPTNTVNGTALISYNAFGDAMFFKPWYAGTYMPIRYDHSNGTGVKARVVNDRYWAIEEKEYDRWLKALSVYAGVLQD